MGKRAFPELPSEEEILSRTVEACRMAGLSFRIIDGRLTICFERLDWSKWPALKMLLEDLGSANLLRFIESHDEFKRQRMRQSWKLVSAGAGNTFTVVRSAIRRPRLKTSPDTGQ